MKHFRTEENQQNRPFKKQSVLDSTSRKESGKITNNLFINASLFDHCKLLNLLFM